MNKGLFSFTLKCLVCLLIFCVVMPSSAYAQTGSGEPDNKVSGTVIDVTGWPIIGAAVLIKGTTIGSSTDLDGHFEFDLPSDMEEGSELEFSCLGYKTLIIPLGTRRIFDVTMEDDAILMEGTVVTALGIKRSEKALSYNVQQVNADDITANKDAIS